MRVRAGEYVAVEKLEATYKKAAPVVDQVRPRDRQGSASAGACIDAPCYTCVFSICLAAYCFACSSTALGCLVLVCSALCRHSHLEVMHSAALPLL